MNGILMADKSWRVKDVPVVRATGISGPGHVREGAKYPGISGESQKTVD
jgi:hypothetical protein